MNTLQVCEIHLNAFEYYTTINLYPNSVTCANKCNGTLFECVIGRLIHSESVGANDFGNKLFMARYSIRPNLEIYNRFNTITRLIRPIRNFVIETDINYCAFV